MKFKLEPDSTFGYYLYIEENGKYKLICFRFTKFFAKLTARRIARRTKRIEEFEL